jgi:hypothetical protein
MEKGQSSSLILSRLDLGEVEDVVWEPYHRVGPGRPPRNPVGIKARAARSPDFLVALDDPLAIVNFSRVHL